MIKKFGLFHLLILLATAGLAQEYADPNHRALMLKMEEGVSLMNQGDYASADFQFQQVLEEIGIVPAELCFYFGKNSYHLEKYKQSIDWLNKYIELKGTHGQFFDQATEYLRLSETDYLAQKRAQTTTSRPSETKKAQPKVVDCDTTPYVLCPVCQGNGVIVEQGSLGNAIYRTCPYSDEQGRMPCSNYKEYMKGNPIPLESED
uniref:Transmembrane protein 106 N-terminal domain-containing protein n=1 Tax=Roseihalotalea indica TaxID=2867963 RepID=A0AA49JG67_9BACT|nr:hypothetical protein K4G66_30285 [Tunicatimonas sp. TK19036]